MTGSQVRILFAAPFPLCDLRACSGGHSASSRESKMGRPWAAEKKFFLISDVRSAVSRAHMDHTNQLTTRHAVAANVAIVVIQPSVLVSRLFTRPPITLLSLVNSIMIRSRGGTEKP